MWWGNRHAAAARPIHTGLRPTASAPAQGAAPDARTRWTGRRQAGGFGWYGDQLSFERHIVRLSPHANLGGHGVDVGPGPMAVLCHGGHEVLGQLRAPRRIVLADDHANHRRAALARTDAERAQQLHAFTDDAHGLAVLVGFQHE